ncbi:MAG: AmmeMemoRadiSam system protein B [Spirochaetia bacterium]|nr:AmmeMemoRadiSam system protein B [Spirochaetia bacterium]
MLREPVVAGMFYEKETYALKKQVDKLLVKIPEKTAALGVIVPHAGYLYSGKVAGEVYSSIIIPETIIILGPNHTGLGAPVSVFADGEWRTPLGDARINEPLADAIIKGCTYAKKDILAHAREHSIEVQLPFIQELRRDFSFVPVCIREYERDVLRQLADTIADVLKGRNALIAASSDMTHYESAGAARKKDTMLIEIIEEMDEEKMFDTVTENDLSMCGFIPVFVMLRACKKLGAKKAKLIDYNNSGDAVGDYTRVVGYAGVAVI